MSGLYNSRGQGSSPYDPLGIQLRTNAAAARGRKGSSRIEELIEAIKDIDREIRTLERSKKLRKEHFATASEDTSKEMSLVDGEITDLKSVRASELDKLEAEFSITKTIGGML
jgi:hypothetical protein